MAASTLGAALRMRPEAPAELGSAAMLEGIYQRALESLEAGPLGVELAKVLPVTAAEAPPMDLAETPPQLLRTDLAESVAVSPPMPPAATWSAMRSSILAGASAPSRRVAGQPRRWLLLVGAVAASVAATVTVSLVLEGRPSEPHISFTELAAAPAVELTILRHGAMR